MSISKPHVLLLTPPRFYPCSEMNIRQYSEVLFHIKAYLREDAIVDIRDFELELGMPEDENQVERVLLSAAGVLSRMPRYDYIGISCYTSYSFLSTIAIGKLIKQTWPNAKIIVGGYHPTAIPDDFIYEDSPFNFIVRGEGEDAMRQIVRGEVRPDNSSQVIVGQQLAAEYLPDVSFEGMNYTTDSAVISLSRGCPMKCSYCCQSGQVWSKWRAISPQRALDCVKRIYEVLGKRGISFSDSYFGANKKWLVDFLKGLISINLPIIYSAECRADTLTDEVMNLISELEFKVMFGIESLSPWTLRVMNKARNPEAYIDASLRTIDRCFQKDIPCKLFFLMNHPGETVESLNETITKLDTFIRNYEQASCYIELFPFQLFPGNRIYENLEGYIEKYGFKVEQADWWRTNDGDMATRCIASTSIADKYGSWPGYWRKPWAAVQKEVWKRMSLRSYKIHFWNVLEYFQRSNYSWISGREELFAKIVMTAHRAYTEVAIDYDVMLRNYRKLAKAVRWILEKKIEGKFIKAVLTTHGGLSQADTEILDKVGAICDEFIETHKAEIKLNRRILTEARKEDTLCFQINRKKYDLRIKDKLFPVCSGRCKEEVI